MPSLNYQNPPRVPTLGAEVYAPLNLAVARVLACQEEIKLAQEKRAQAEAAIKAAERREVAESVSLSLEIKAREGELDEANRDAARASRRLPVELAAMHERAFEVSEIELAASSTYRGEVLAFAVEVQRLKDRLDGVLASCPLEPFGNVWKSYKAPGESRSRALSFAVHSLIKDLPEFDPAQPSPLESAPKPPKVRLGEVVETIYQEGMIREPLDPSAPAPRLTPGEILKLRDERKARGRAKALEELGRPGAA